MELIKRANETNDNTMPDKNILAILYEEISKDPREALRITVFIVTINGFFFSFNIGDTSS